MSETTENTFTVYLGPEFQQKLMWQLLVEPEFAEKTIPNLAIEYFDDPNLKRLFIIILEFFKEYEKVPNLQNKSIHQAINKYKTPNNIIEEESLFSVIKRIDMWNERIINKQILHDGDVVQRATNSFIKQQEYRKLAEFIIEKTKSGEIKNKTVVAYIEEKFQKISHIGEEVDDCEEVIEGIDKALRKEFRQTIATGVDVLDALTGGGLGKGEIGVILTPSGVGKSLPLSAKLLTPNGWIKMGDIKVNDLVIGSNGKPQKVLGVYPQGKRPIYKIEFNDETTAFCDKKHLWSVNTLNQRTANTTRHINGKLTHIKTPDFSYVPIIMEELMKNYIVCNKSRKKLNYRIPIIQPIHFNENKLQIHPYVLGVMLGDGYMKGCSFTTSDLDIVDNIKKFYNNEISIKLDKRKTNKLYKVRLFKSKEKIKECGLFESLSNNKFIPLNYKFNSIENRISLLQGLLDTDGYASKRGRIQYSTVSKELAYDVRELVLSLGGFCKIRKKIPKYKNEIKIGQESYTLTVSFSNEEIKPFRLKRKQERVIYRKKYKCNKYISLISYSHDEEAQCIYVENNDHLYVTDDYILTHNTTLLTKIANTAYELEKNVAQVIFEDTKDQIKRKHYAIWSGIPLSKMDDEEENIKVKKLVNEKVKKLQGKGRIVIKRFGQENTTMMDIRNWMLGYQKKYGFKFDELVLDYLDCLESHKKSPDRNEAELQIIKSFEALSSDFDIPAWTAIQSNRSGFGAEFVEAQHTGGSIKRIQKSHLFMTVAKTPEQQEANLANIKIIKARFAKDGQTFQDCIFDNDKMQIIIEDDRYKYNKMYRGQKHHDEEDVNKMENQANKLLEKSTEIRLHEAISKANNDDVNDEISNSVLKNLEKTYIEQKEFEKEKIANEGVAISGVTGNTITTNDLLDWNGESGCTTTEIINEQPEVKIEDVESLIEIELEEKLPDKIIISDKSEDLTDLEKNFSDPDEPQNEYKSVRDMLIQERKRQNVIKKE
jgi:replicative DNA helicase